MAEENISQNEIEALLNQSTGSADTPEQPAPANAPSLPDAVTTSAVDTSELSSTPATAANPSTSPGSIAQTDMETLLNQAQEALQSVDDAAEELPSGVKRFELSNLSTAPASTEHASLDLLQDVELDLKIELGRTRMHLEEVLQLQRGSVVPLDKLAGDPVDVYVNGRLIARGEVLVLNDNFCIRVAELIAGEVSA